MKKVLTILLAVIFTMNLFGEEKFNTSRYMNLKNMGMGGAGRITGNDENAILYNPAMLKSVEDADIVLRGDFAVSADAMDMTDAYQELLDDVDKIDEEADMVSLLNAYLNGTSYTIVKDGEEIVLNENENNVSNEFLRMKFGSFLGYVGHSWGTGVFMSGNINTAIVNPNNPEVITDVDMSVQAPVAYSFKVGKMNVGVGLRYVSGVDIYSTLGAADLLEFSDNDSETEEIYDLVDAKLAKGYGTSIGVSWEGERFDFAASLVDPISNVTISKYVEVVDPVTSESDFEEEEIGDAKLPTNLSIGMSSKRDKDLRWAVELENLLSEDMDGNGHDDENLYKKLHAGAEYDFGILTGRVGLNQGYLTWGLGVKLLFLTLDYADFREELGPHLGMEENHVRALSLGMKF